MIRKSAWNDIVTNHMHFVKQERWDKEIFILMEKKWYCAWITFSNASREEMNLWGDFMMSANKLPRGSRKTRKWNQFWLGFKT
jgi:hypothetical protein